MLPVRHKKCSHLLVYLSYKLMPLWFMILTFTGLLIGSTTWAQEHALQPVRFDEGVNPPKPIGGSMIEAVMVAEDEPSVDKPWIYASLPETKAHYLCMSVNSQSGRYFAKLVYDISSVTAGFITLAYPKKQPTIIIDFASDGLVACGKLSDDCSNSDTGEMIVTGWNSFDKISNIRFYINSDNEIARLIVPTGGELPYMVASCQPIGDVKKRFEYDKACELAVQNEMDLSNGWLEILRGGQRVYTEDIRVRIK